MSKFYDVITHLKKKARDTQGNILIIRVKQLEALIECAELVFQTRNEKNGVGSMPVSAAYAIKRVSQCDDE